MFDQVFLSYANVDLGQATRLKSFLDEVKIRSFFAPDIRAGADWPRVLEIKIRNSAVLVVVLSAGANNADGMRQEVALAEGLDKPILVFRPGSAAVPLPDYLRQYRDRGRQLVIVDELGGLEKQIRSLLDNDSGLQPVWLKSPQPPPHHLVERRRELETLGRSLVEGRMAVVFGPAGCGKSTLVRQLIDRERERFEGVLSTSMRLYADCADFVCDSLHYFATWEAQPPDLSRQQQRDRFLDVLRTRRILLIVDDLDCLRADPDMLPLFAKALDPESFHSRIVVIGRERPALAQRPGRLQFVELPGLEVDGIRELLSTFDPDIGDDSVQLSMSDYYANPGVLAFLGRLPRRMHGGSLANVLRASPRPAGDLLSLIRLQIESLSAPAARLLFAAVMWGEAMPLEAILALNAKRLSDDAIQSALVELASKGLVSADAPGVRVSGIVGEYVTGQITQRIVDEARNDEPDLLFNCPLVRADAPDFIRERQLRNVAKPVAEELCRALGSLDNVIEKLANLLGKAGSLLQSPYAGANVIHLLGLLKVNLAAPRLQGLFNSVLVEKADLTDLQLQDVDFGTSTLRDCVFREDIGGTFSLAWSPQGSLLYTGGGTGEIHAWRVNDLEKLAFRKGHTDVVWSVAAAWDDRFVLTAGADGYFGIWDVSTGQPVLTRDTHEDYLTFVALHPDERTFAVGGATGQITLWTFPGAEYIDVLPSGHATSVHTGAFSASGRLFAAGARDGSIRVWDVSDITRPVLQHELRPHSGLVHSLVFSPDESHIFSGGKDGTTCATELASKRTSWTARGNLPVNSVSVSPDGQWLATAGDERVIRIWSLRKMGEPVLHQCLQGHAGVIHSVAFRPDGTALASASSDNTIRIWDATAGRQMRSIVGSRRWVYSVAYSAASRRFAIGSQDGFVRLWDPESAAFTPVGTHSDGAAFVAASPTENILASGGFDRAVWLWSPSGKSQKLPHQHDDAVVRLSFSDDGALLASASQRNIHRWNLTTGTALSPLSGLGSRVGSVVFQPGTHNLLVSRDDGAILLVGDGDRGPSPLIGRHTGKIRAMAFHPVSHVLAVAGDGTEVTFWDPKARRRMEPSLWLNDEGPGGSWINSIAFTADGSLLAAGDSRGFVTVWDTSSHQRLHRWNAHSSAVNGLTFGGDPEMLATVGSDGFVGLWKKESFERVRAVQSPLPYDGVDLRRASGLTVLRRATLCALGAQTETPAQTT